MVESTLISTSYKNRSKRGKAQKSNIGKDEFFKRVRNVGLTNDDFANALGISRQTVKGWGSKAIPLFAERMLILLEHINKSKEFLDKNILKI